MILKSASNSASESSRKAQDDSDPAPAVARYAITPIDNRVTPGYELLMAHDPGNPRCEKIRALRTELLLRRAPTDRADIIALLSPCAGEGRSLLAAELALAFAQTGSPTLLVDADFRHPHQHVLFGTDNRQGLAQAIEHDVKPLLRPVHGVPRMSMLTGGVIASNPLELLSSNSFATMLDEWRDNFKFVIIDTPPAVDYSDGLAVASLAGRVLALSRARHTPYRDMQDMLRRLHATGSQILGGVISHF